MKRANIKIRYTQLFAGNVLAVMYNLNVGLQYAKGALVVNTNLRKVRQRVLSAAQEIIKTYLGQRHALVVQRDFSNSRKEI